MTSRLPALLLAVLAMGSAVAPSAWAQAPAPATPALDEARQRYERALELSDEGNHEAALFEFRRAYALAPSYRILYNLGVTSVSVRDYVKAIEYFTQYIKDGGTEIEPLRLAEVNKQLERLRGRIAELTIVVGRPGADVQIDDVSVGKAPLPPLTVNAGKHKLSAISPGYLPATVVVELAGTDKKTVELTPTRSTSVVSTAAPSRNVPWIGWGVTAALGAGSIITGVFALKAANRYEEKQATFGTNTEALQSSFRGTRALSITTDVLLVGTIVAAGVSTYLTIWPSKSKAKTKAASLVFGAWTF